MITPADPHIIRFAMPPTSHGTDEVAASPNYWPGLVRLQATSAGVKNSEKTTPNSVSQFDGE